MTIEDLAQASPASITEQGTVTKGQLLIVNGQQDCQLLLLLLLLIAFI